MNKILIWVLALTLLSCNQVVKIEFEYTDLSSGITDTLHSKLIYQSDSKYFSDIECVNDSILAIVQQKDEMCIMLLNMHSGLINSQIGFRGHGPNDLLDPSFVPNPRKDTDEYIYIHDINSRKFLRMNFNNMNTDSVFNELHYPDDIFPSVNLNYSNSFFIGRKAQINEEKNFYIYNKITGTVSEVDHYLKLKNLDNKDYYLATNLGLNEDKNRIITGMYFLDIIQLYDLYGNLIKTISFTENNVIPKIDSRLRSFDFSKGYTGITSIYPTKDFCFLRRDEVVPIFQNNEIIESRKSSIIQIDWDGNIIKNYYIDDLLMGSFCVDDSIDNLYAIRNQIKQDREYFEIISYEMN